MSKPIKRQRQKLERKKKRKQDIKNLVVARLEDMNMKGKKISIG